MTALSPQSGGKVPFANATEGDAWSAAWCDLCVHDHNMHTDTLGSGCDLMLSAMIDPDRLPEGWLDVPAGYGFHLPSHMVCMSFQPCTLDDCTGDAGADERAERVAVVQRAWGQQPSVFPAPETPVQCPGQLDVFGGEAQ